MDTRRAFVLNLDADEELAASARYAPTLRVKEAMRPHVAALARTLLRDGDLLVDDDTLAGTALSATGAPLPGLAFCPTPRALGMLRRAGAEPVAHPSFDVLRRVNGRAFAASLGPTLPGGAFVTDLGAALAHLASTSAVSSAWRVKRAFGMAGRGQRVIACGALDSADKAFVQASIARDRGVQIEPNLHISIELGLHGSLTERGTLTAGNLVHQRCDARGAWLATEPLPEDHPARIHEPALRAELARVGVALHEASYFGAFGIDAFVYFGAGNQPNLQPRSEVNARYSMGWPIGMAGAPSLA